MTRLLCAIVLAGVLGGLVAGAAGAGGSPRYDRQILRNCLGGRVDVLRAVSPLPREIAPLSAELRRNVVFVSFFTSAPSGPETDAVLVFGRDAADARSHGQMILMAAQANLNLPRPSFALATGNVAFFTLGRLTTAVAGDLKTCFLRARSVAKPDFVV